MDLTKDYATICAAEPRLVSKLDKRGDCWMWTGTRNRDGYGRIKLHGRWAFAHRVAFTIAHGPIPDGMVVMHVCDTPACCNPAHLRCGTPSENSLDRAAKGRSSRGESRWSAKLSADDVLSIIKLYRSGAHSQASIGRMFGVGNTSVSHIVNGRRWRHLSGLAQVAAEAQP